MKFVLNRSRTVSGSGHTIALVKGEPTHVPPELYQEVLAVGGVPEQEVDLDGDAKQPVQVPDDAAEREAALMAVFEGLVVANARGTFTAGGMPHLGVLKERLGWEVSAKERDVAWVKFQTADAE